MTARLMRLALRRERTIAPWWLLLLVTGALSMIAYIKRNMGTPELLNTYVEMINHNSFFRALGGAYVIADPDYMAAWRSGGLLYLSIALAAILTVVRHTRADEDTGRIELLRAGAVGRYAPLTAALIVGGGISLLGGALTTLTVIASGLDPAGSVAYGAAIAAAGLVFGAIAAVTVQLARSARAARGIAFLVLATAYVLRYAGDASGQYWMKYISPIGWSHLVNPYNANRWWVLAVPIVVTAVLTYVAYRLLDRRDLGEGLIPESQGPAEAPSLRGPVRLSWRLHRGLLAKWAFGIAAFGVAAGGASTLAYQLANTPSPSVQALLESFSVESTGTTADVINAGMWSLVLIFGYAIALYPVLMVQRLRGEETSGRAEAVQGTTITRLRWAFGHLVVTWLGTAALLAIAGIVFGAAFAALVTHSPADILRILGGMLGLIPATWVVGAVCMLAYGLLPRLSIGISWAVWVFVVLSGRVVGPLYNNWAGSPFEPFHYVSNTVAGGSFQVAPELGMVVLAALLAAGGLAALRRRDFG
ncbi:ABC transporter permease [Tenggerimyces flavus]|uniref:ABC transporter permease n=1 Tax=Tenggerimyces flavus TaxID=1708749 RepID=A0ABV7YH02_9ACTN|nr:hypothetical protein [Tenggerimyces flavus]MBM7784698.1 ABC-2 type transport system permease protein [Tenggerimyces flavus]